MNKICVKQHNKLIQVDEMGSSYSAIDSAFLYVKDLSDKDTVVGGVTSDENLPKMNVWMLQDEEKKDLLKRVLRAEDLLSMCAMIVLDFEEPWEMMNSLHKWLSVLSETVFALQPDLPLEVQNQMKEHIANYIKTYEEPQMDENGNPVIKEEMEDLEKDNEDELESLKMGMQLAEGVLKVNMGIPIVVVCSKVDLLQKEDAQELDKNFDFIQRHLRTLSLQYGTGLLFVSTLTSINIELLYRYMLHRIYGFEFLMSPMINAKDSLFIPAGYDSLTLI